MTVNEHVAQIADLMDHVKELVGQVENLEGKQSDTQEKWLGNQELRRVVNKLETQYPELNARVVKLEGDVQALSAVLHQMVATQAAQAAHLELMQQDFEASRRGACTHGAHHHSACSCATDTHTHPCAQARLSVRAFLRPDADEDEKGSAAAHFVTMSGTDPVQTHMI